MREDTGDISIQAGREIVGHQPSLERFYMPLIYKPDQVWARTMQTAVGSGVDLLHSTPETTLDDLISTMVNTARTGLAERAAAFKGSEEQSTKVSIHAENFGIIRRGSQQVTSISDIEPMSVYKDQAVDILKRLGIHFEEDDIWGRFSPKKRGKTFKREVYALQHVFEARQGDTTNLCRVESKWIPTHDEERVRTPFREVTVTSPFVDVIKPMFEAGNTVLEETKRLKQQLDNGELLKDEVTLNRLTNYVTQLYWMISQTWPYERGNAGVADLASKAIFDWLGVYIPNWKDDVNPNIAALLYPLNEFQEKYLEMYQESLKWE